MRPLTQDDLLPLDEYVGRRREFHEAHGRYLDRYRRVRVGPRVTLLFENRQTLWFHIQELLRIARLTEPETVQQELNLYNRLLPGRDQLQAALLLEIADEAKLTEELAFWRGLQGDQIHLRVGQRRYPAHLVTSRPEDRCFGTAHWIQFTIDTSGRLALADFRQPAALAIEHSTYRHTSAALSEDIRQSLLDDLELSDRDG